MQSTFDQFVAEQDAKNTIQLNIRKYCLMLCDALRQNFIQYSINIHKRALSMGEKVDYHEACIVDLKNGNCGYKFYIEEGRKYHKIIMDAHGSRSVHCFVDKKTGEVYKSASWKAPAKGVRYNLLNIASREECFARADWSGGYLYNR